jgi:hypothetical protein
MRAMLLAVLILAGGLCGKAFADESWQDALGQMPFSAGVTKLTRTNAIPLILDAFQSNRVFKALIFMPGAADEFVFLRRAQVTLNDTNASLAKVITALTNQTYIRVCFRPPFLLLYTTEDDLGPIATIKSKSAFARLQARVVSGSMSFCDSNWDFTRRAVAGKVGIGVRPFSDSPSSWHFWPNNFVAYDLTQWELLEAMALSGKTRLTLHWLTADFQLDMHPGTLPDPSSLPVP